MGSDTCTQDNEDDYSEFFQHQGNPLLRRSEDEVIEIDFRSTKRKVKVSEISKLFDEQSDESTTPKPAKKKRSVKLGPNQRPLDTIPRPETSVKHVQKFEGSCCKPAANPKANAGPRTRATVTGTD
jgi:hypothetical protein